MAAVQVGDDGKISGLSNIGSTNEEGADHETGPLDSDRAGASFNVAEMASLLAGDPKSRETKEQAIAFAESDPLLCEMQRNAHYLTDRCAIVKNTLERLYHVKRLEHEGKINSSVANTIIFDLGLDSGGLGLHSGVFMPTLKNMTTQEQYDAWVPPAQNLRWIGCYAQTELAHGSNVRGLQTTCTFIPETDEFEVHTPSVGATKWWPGGLGVLSTHCVLYARLVVGGVDYGVHNFLVQIRSLDDHSPLPGITIGDIGPKFGTNSNDNGFLAFDHTRIPRFNLFAKFSHVTRDGKYVKPPSKGGAGVYGTMTVVRANIAARAFGPLASATTIAVRYAAVRRQEPGAPQGQERPVIDYSSVQWRLLPQVATAYALRFMGFSLMDEITQLNAQARENPEQAGQAASTMHASTCALKSICTYLAADGIEECRRACGGHGFSNFSGLPKIYADYFQNFTPEGDNWLLTQQTCSIVLRHMEVVDSGAVGVNTPSTAYLSRYKELLAVKCSAESPNDLMQSIGALHEAMEHRAAWLWQELREITENLTHEGMSLKEAKSQTLVEQFHAARAHGLAVIVGAFARGIEQRATGTEARLFERLAVLFTLVHIQKDRGDFLTSGWLSSAQAKLLQPAVRRLCQELRPDAVPLVDAFGKSDFELNSAIGASDGCYEERLLQLAKNEPLNALWNAGGSAPSEYFESLKPMMELGQGAEGGVYAQSKL
jgi:acyl-CoA oxidase